MSLRWESAIKTKGRFGLECQATSNVQSEDEDLAWRISRESGGGDPYYSLAFTHSYPKDRAPKIRFDSLEYAKAWCEAEDRRIIEDGLKDGSILET